MANIPKEKPFIVKALQQGVKICYEDKKAVLGDGIRRGIVVDANVLTVKVYAKGSDPEIRKFSLSADGRFTCLVEGIVTQLRSDEPEEMFEQIIRGMGAGVRAI